MRQKKKRWFICMLLGILGATLLVNLLTRKGTIRAAEWTVTAVKMYNAALSFNLFWNTKILLKWTSI